MSISKQISSDFPSSILLKQLLIIFLFFNPSILFAQQTQKGNIIGNVIDDNSKEPIEFATIRLNGVNSELMSGTITDKEGKFTLSLIGKGNFVIVIDHLGFKTKKIDVNILNSNNKINLGRILLEPSSILLKSVKVNGKISYQTQVDRTIISPDSTLLKTSMNALDVMSKIPGLIVNRLTNTVSILGSKRVLVLINGVYRNGNNDLLSISPSDIDKIEIIKTPSSKYNAEYTGVINVILKKKNISGITMELEPGFYGYRHNDSQVKLEYGIGRFRFFANYLLYYRNHSQKKNSIVRIDSGTSSIVNSATSSIANPFELGHFIDYGTDYFFNNSTFLNFTGDYKIIYAHHNAISINNSYLNNIWENGFSTKSNTNGKYIMQNYSMYFKKNFQKHNAELSSSINLYKMHFLTNNHYENTYYNQLGLSDTSSSHIQKGNDDKSSLNFRIDYSLHFGENFHVESGYQLYYRAIKNIFNQNSVQENFVYQEKRNSLYANLYYVHKKWDITVGLRIENSALYINDSIKNVKWSKDPDLGILYRFNSKQNISLNFRTHILRPDFYQLQPFVYELDSLHYEEGNPYLEPSIHNKINLSYTYRNHGIMVSPSVYFNWSKNDIANTRYFINEVQYVKEENVAQGENLGATLTASFTFFKMLKINPFFEWYCQSFENDTLSTLMQSNSFYLSGSLSLKHDLFVGFNLGFPGKSIYLQGYTQQKFAIDALYVGKQIMKKKGMFLVGVSNPFNDLIINRREKNISYSLFSQSITKMRMFIIKFSYRFHKGRKSRNIKIPLHMEQDY